MSRVKRNNKFVNTVRYDTSITNTSKMIRVHHEGEDYRKCASLSHWLFVKYDMAYKTYRNKSKSRREQLKEEFFNDTGIKN